MSVVKTGLFWTTKDELQNGVLDNVKHAYSYQHPREPEQIFNTYIELPDKVGVPTGDISKAKRLLGFSEYEDRTVVEPVERTINLTGLTLRQYQEDSLSEALDYFNNEGGTSFNLSGEPGSGKSVLLSAVIAELGVKTLIIAHLSMLTTQLLGEIQQFTDADVRILDDSNLELGDVNIATSQFISKRPELWYKIKKHVGLIVCDEAETLASETTMRIFQRAHAKYRIAVTATFTRSVDGRTPALLDMIGDKVITLTNDKLLKPTVIMVDCDEYFQAPTNKKLYKRYLVSFFRKNTSITDKVVEITKSSVNKGRQVLIATDLKEFQEAYAKSLEAIGISCGIMNGSTKKEDRDKILKEYDEGKVQVLIGFGVLNAGLSIPKISTVIRVSTPSSIEKLEQLIGRGRRDFDGKEGMWFIDLMYRGFSTANSKRKSLYKRKQREDGWTIAHTSWDKFKEKL